MKFTLLITILLILPAVLIMGQSEITVSRKDFKTDKPGFDAAWQHVKDGDSFYTRGGVWYNSAIIEYKAAYIYNNKNAELNYKLGASCLYSDNKELASEYLIKALSLKANVSDDILLITGRSLQYTGQYKAAADKINEWLASGVKKTPEEVTKANKYLAECKYAGGMLKDSLKIEIRNMGGNINSSADEYSEILSHDGEKMYFASRRAISADSKNYYSDTRFDENIYRSDFESGNWSVALLAAKNLKTEFCETPLDIEASGTILYIYAGYEGNGDIQVAEFKKGEWKSPRPEPFGINSAESETSFSMAPAGTEIAFISNRGKKGGGKDVYFIYKDDSKWSKPVNAGSNINSDYSEESVRFSKGGDTLWFSSSGRNTFGGFDIFYSTRKDGREWTPAVNAGYPINTAWDEFFYFPAPSDKNLFYFVSNRGGGYGGLDIYTGRKRSEITLKPMVNPQPAEIKTDSVPGIILQKPDTVIVTDTALVRKSIIK
jgi:tetratricopeptide (TPR) repeat protein